MKFNVIGTDKTKSVKAKTSQGEVDFTPTFSENDLVEIKPEFKGYSTEFNKLINHKFTVAYCKVAELGDMIEEVLYLKECISDETIKVLNPYLVKHFKEYTEE